jgi:hypothetical protein
MARIASAGPSRCNAAVHQPGNAGGSVAAGHHNESGDGTGEGQPADAAANGQAAAGHPPKGNIGKLAGAAGVIDDPPLAAGV